MAKIKVLTQDVTTIKYKEEDYISLTDIANAKDGEQRVGNDKTGYWKKLK